MILYCAADLLWASKIKGTADALSLPCRPVRNLEMLRARLVDSPVRSLIVDLEAGEAALDLIRHLRAGPDSQTSAIRILAFGPHVNVEGLQAAKSLGADVIMTRGAFSSRLPDILKSLESAVSSLRDEMRE